MKEEKRYAMDRHIITDADIARIRTEIIEHQIASGDGQSGRKRIVLRVRCDNTLSWIVTDPHFAVPYVNFSDAVEAYNEL